MRVACLALLAAVACATGPAAPPGYRLAGTGSHWSDGEGEAVLRETRSRYPEFFQVILDPADTRSPDLRPLRDDLEHAPADARNFAALHAVAIGYFELNYRAESQRGGALYLGHSFRAAHLVAVPWRAYGEVEDPGLRDAILDFFEDAGSGEKLGSAATAPRLSPIVASLESKESDPERRARIRRLAAQLAGSGGAPRAGP